MKKVILVLLTALVLSLPQVSSAELYFLACQDVQITNSKGVTKDFKKGTLFYVYSIPMEFSSDSKLRLQSPGGYVSLNSGRLFEEKDINQPTQFPKGDPSPLFVSNDFLKAACEDPIGQEFSVKGHTYTDFRKIQEARQEEGLKEKEQENKAKVRQEKAAKQEATKKQAILAKYNVKAEVSADDLRKNPFQFEGKVILLTGVGFDRMLEKGLAVFKYETMSVEWVRRGSVVSSSTQELLVSKVPVDFSKGYADLIVKGKGTTKATNSLGGVITLPLVEYIAVCE
jgi:hypothetical protein